MDEVTVSFGSPEHGWLPVTVGTAHWKRAESVSHVPCDSLAQLVCSLSLIASGSAREHVEWSLEPEWWRWTFESDAKEMRLSISWPSGHVETARVPKHAALQVFCRSLLRLGADPVWAIDDVDHAWMWPFPREALDRLRSRVLDA